MENLEDSILKILNSKFISHKGITHLSNILSRILKVDPKVVLECLSHLILSGDIFEFTQGKFAGSKLLGLVKGKFSLTNQKFGFVLNDSGDIFIARRNIGSALDGDIVLAKVLSRAFGTKKDVGKIVKVLERNDKGLVGTFRRMKNFGYVIIDKSNYEVKIPKKYILGAKDGDKVVIDILSYDKSHTLGRITEVIGNLSKAGNDIKWMLRQYKVEDKFPGDVLKVASEMPTTIGQEYYKTRRNLTKEMIFTIDGKDAKDLDDAISLKENKDGTYDLGVHIADVGEYVKLGSPIDKEAFKRGTSIYFLDTVIPMLPKELSNGICSLNENVDRLALSVQMKISKEGDVISSDIFESIINSKHRLNYDEVLEVIEGNKETEKRLSDISGILHSMFKLSNILSKKRTSLGMLDFDLPESIVTIDPDGKPIDVKKREETKATKIIENFMVIANEVVAKRFENLNIPFVYRVHEKPDKDKIHSFFNFVSTLGIELPTDENKDISPKDLQNILSSVKDKDLENVVNMVMLRSLKKAQYMDKCLGHFGMALKYYCHFTAPIRRYPDLTIHRIIKEYLHKNIEFLRSSKMSDVVSKASIQSSLQEKNADDVERAIIDYKKCEYMSQFVGKTFEGIISGINARGFYVELSNTCEGFVSISTMKDEFYNFDEENFMLTSKNNFYKIGGRVEVRLLGCTLSERKVNFELIRKIKGKIARGR